MYPSQVTNTQSRQSQLKTKGGVHIKLANPTGLNVQILEIRWTHLDSKPIVLQWDPLSFSYLIQDWKIYFKTDLRGISRGFGPNQTCQ